MESLLFCCILKFGADKYVILWFLQTIYVCTMYSCDFALGKSCLVPSYRMGKCTFSLWLISGFPRVLNNEELPRISQPNTKTLNTL